MPEITATDLIRAARAAEAGGQMGRVAQLCSQALQIEPMCVDALLMMGSLAARQGHMTEAEKLLRSAAEADPESYDAVRWLTTLLIGKDGGAEAVLFGEAAARLRPDAAEAHAVLGLAAMGHGDSLLAISSFQRAAELSPDMSGAYHNLGVALQREESYEEAIDAFRHAISLAPGVLESYLHLARCFIEQNLGDEALDCATRALQINPKSRSAQIIMSDATYCAVHGKNGLAHLRRAIEINPQAGYPHALMGSRLQENGDFAAATESIERSMQLQPVQGFVYYLLAHNRKYKPEDRALVERVEAISRRHRLNPMERRYIHFALGKLYDDLGEYENAMLNFDQANREADDFDRRAAEKDAEIYRSRVRRFIGLFTAEFLEQFKNIGLESEEPIFVFGMPRSGTTLVEQIISRHTTVGAAGEQFFWRDTSRRTVRFREGRLDVPALRAAGHKYLEELRLIAPGNARVTDKFPSNYIYLGLLCLIFPNARFIHTMRHPLDTCLSMYMRPFKSVHNRGQTRQRLVETYQLYLESMRHWRVVLPPGRILEVQYEDLVQNQEENTRRIIAHCGLEWEDACLRPEQGDRRVLTFSMWQVRQPVYTTSVERWRNYEPWLGELRELVEKER